MKISIPKYREQIL